MGCCASQPETKQTYFTASAHTPTPSVGPSAKPLTAPAPSSAPAIARSISSEYRSKLPRELAISLEAARAYEKCESSEFWGPKSPEGDDPE
eukprot:CAMPEP_0198222768 /NCGR_PEP_ID=MMETSP1445-20131203/89549_1 /TAXON_ID=36898 /ORGANISM="Pyramimonas sp., Strain CCMP2087" /LENGTH=90 /DNA_ID=CAMNT_0043901391 /DNA_START=118 /DNA_END=387 /DNA_ORIENTATION=-